MRKWLKGIGVISIIVGFIAFMVLMSESGTTGTQQYGTFGFLILLGSIVEGIFCLGFAEILERLEGIQNNTRREKAEGQNAGSGEVKTDDDSSLSKKINRWMKK
jgi:hypothetical protein